MATSGTSAFALNIGEVIEEAFNQCGMKMKTGYDLTTARRSIDLMMLEWQNRGINFWTVEQTSVTLTASAVSQTLETDTIDIIEAFIRTGSGTSQVDLPMTRISSSEYSQVPSKNSQGRPVNFWLDKQLTAPVMYLWPVPDKGTYTLIYYKLRRIEDTGSLPGATDPDVPARFLPALVSGLAYRISSKYPELLPRRSDLKMEYAEQWELALSGDRDRSSLRFVPGGYRNP